MSGRLAGKRALITGAGSGIGAAIAAAFVAEGARVLLTDIDANAAAAQAQAIRAATPNALPPALSCRLDVTSEAEWAAALAFARQELGGLSVLVNNAGIGIGGTVESTPLSAWRQAFAVNADGVFLGCQQALPLLRENGCRGGGAAIVNVASIAAIVARADMAAYGASKAAVWSLTRSVALHCAEQGWPIRCNALMPGWTDTPMLDTIECPAGVPREKLAAALAAQLPMGRLGSATEVAQGAVFLASDESAFMTGAELKLDGGLSAG